MTSTPQQQQQQWLLHSNKTCLRHCAIRCGPSVCTFPALVWFAVLTRICYLQMYSAADQKQHLYAPVFNANMMRPNQGHSSQQSSAQVPNYAESVVRAMLLPTAARQHQAQHYSQYRQSQAQPQPRYNNPAAAGLHIPHQHSTTQHTVAQSGFANTPGSGVAPNNFSRFYDAGRMRR
jgi:hypothetical protein